MLGQNSKIRTVFSNVVINYASIVSSILDLTVATSIRVSLDALRVAYILAHHVHTNIVENLPKIGTDYVHRNSSGNVEAFLQYELRSMTFFCVGNYF